MFQRQNSGRIFSGSSIEWNRLVSKPVARLVFVDNEEKKDPLIGALAGLGRTKGDLTEPVVDTAVWELD